MSICDKLRNELDEEYVRINNVVDNLVTMDVQNPLSANQGVILKGLIDESRTTLVKSASVEVCVEDDVPVEGYEVGDKYIDFILNDEEESHIYELLTELPLSNVEVTDNKVTSISSSSTNIQYPSAKAVYDYIQSLDASDVQYPLDD